MNKPDWKDMPKWAKWMAQNADGGWCFFERKPKPYESGGYWCGYRFIDLWYLEKETNSNWRDTLERRP